MPIDLRQVAAISGMNGLYRVVAPTRTGVIVESLSDKPQRMVAQARQRMSLLDEISIYTTDEETTVPLAEVFDRINEKYGDDLPLSEKPADHEYKAFMEQILPDFDEERVYLSDMKKLATWYRIVKQHIGFTAPEKEEKAAEKKAEKKAPKAKATEEKPEAAEEKKTKKKKE
ncbi:DUF5606 domain-containing protein [Pontibacter sp. BT310]|jgi:hypothetical protein|uniref:DUF5606 domain-containing protein n=1 Tax=Pontibacter populi TaxID=890055 RepID=A0ABS6XCP4_9BACT|nr:MULTISPECIES: DUF5606 domain-containing protein [Pontibacter]MBJ6118782.1 DUF5606 domain-containing protein [Pontibacter sp. BT310]MBR0571211.1 DUF5606 domain-containing protein [Microvirga sp. STS03]MBW3365636.1 DUF5606 domain-containing protein [Pontibacter populi]